MLATRMSGLLADFGVDRLIEIVPLVDRLKGSKSGVGRAGVTITRQNRYGP
jgi:hypothetical protein